jgi:hypothetical protein
VDLICAKHPNYKVKQWPRNGCVPCRILYMLKNTGDAVISYTEAIGFEWLKSRNWRRVPSISPKRVK